MGAVATGPASPWFFPAVDGMRGLAIASVLLYHTNWSPRGLFGVDVFFVVSGFLITLLLLRELQKTDRIALGKFYVRRVKRLVPGLIIVLGAVIALEYFYGTLQELQATAVKAIAALAQFANWQQITQGDAYWDQTGQITPLAHMWSLSITEQFYVVWPIALLGIWYLCRRKPTVILAILTGLVAISAMVAPLMWNGSNSDRLYLGTETRAVGFIAGAAAAAAVYLIVSKRVANGTESRSSWIKTTSLTALSLLTLAIVVTMSVVVESYHEAWLYQGGIAAVAVAAAVFTATLSTPHNLLTRFFRFWPFVAFGKISYTVYLLHLPVYWLLQKQFPSITPMMLLAFGGGLTWLIALIVHYAITEKIRLRTWRARFALPALAATTALVVGMATYLPDVRLAQRTDPTASADHIVGSDGRPLQVAPAPDGGRPVVLTLGDSLANDIASSLADHGSGSFAVIDGGIGGCGITGATQVRASSGYTWNIEPACSDWVTTWPQLIKDNTPQYIVIHSYWDAAEQLIDGKWLTAQDPEYRQLYLERLQMVAGWVEQYAPDAKLVFADDRSTNGIITTPAWTTAYTSMIKDFADTHGPNTVVLPYASMICSDGNCESGEEKSLFLPDNVHLNSAGMKALAPRIERFLATLRPASNS